MCKMFSGFSIKKKLKPIVLHIADVARGDSTVNYEFCDFSTRKQNRGSKGRWPPVLPLFAWKAHA